MRTSRGRLILTRFHPFRNHCQGIVCSGSKVLHHLVLHHLWVDVAWGGYNPRHVRFLGSRVLVVDRQLWILEGL